MKVVVNNIQLDCEVAATHEQKMQGLMHQENPPNMVFLYDNPGYNKFWMKNTPCRLLILFCYKGEVISVEEGKPFSLKSVGPNRLSDLVIEVPYDKYVGTFQTGNKVSLYGKSRV